MQQFMENVDVIHQESESIINLQCELADARQQCSELKAKLCEAEGKLNNFYPLTQELKKYYGKLDIEDAYELWDILGGVMHHFNDDNKDILEDCRVWDLYDDLEDALFEASKSINSPKRKKIATDSLEEERRLDIKDRIRDVKQTLSGSTCDC